MNKPHSPLPKAPALRPAAVYLVVQICLLAVFFLSAAPVGADPRSLSDGFVGSSTSDDCFPFDVTTFATGNAIDLLPEANYPYDATITPDGSEVWFVGASGDGIVVIDRATNTITQRITVSEYPIGIAFANDGSLAVVSSRDDEVLDLIDTANYTVTSSLPIPTAYLGAGNVALDPVSGQFYLVDWYGDILYEIAADGSEVLRQVIIGDSLWQLVVAPDGQSIYVTDRGEDLVHVVDRATLTVATSYPVGDDPWGIDITGDGAMLVVACEDSHEIDLIDTANGATTVIAVDSGADPRDVDILDDQGWAFVAGGRIDNPPSDPIYVIDLATQTLLDTFEGDGTNANVIAVQAQMHGSSTGIADGDVPTGIDHLSAHPNPFNPLTVISFTLATASAGELAIYQLDGRLVQVLASGSFDAGQTTVQWDGRDASGRRLGSGVYLVQLRAGTGRQSHKIMLAK